MYEKIYKNKKVTRESKVEEIVANEASAIEKLNDDTLLLIFECLKTVADKIRIERVCKKWQNLAKKSWRSMKHFDFSNDTWAIAKKDCIQLDKDIVTKVGGLCGRYLTSVNLNMPAFLEICKLSPHLQELHLYDIKDHECPFPTTGFCICTPNDWQEILERIMPNISHNIKKFSLKL